MGTARVAGPRADPTGPASRHGGRAALPGAFGAALIVAGSVLIHSPAAARAEIQSATPNQAISVGPPVDLTGGISDAVAAAALPARAHAPQAPPTVAPASKSAGTLTPPTLIPAALKPPTRKPPASGARAAPAKPIIPPATMTNSLGPPPPARAPLSLETELIAIGVPPAAPHDNAGARPAPPSAKPPEQ